MRNKNLRHKYEWIKQSSQKADHQMGKTNKTNFYAIYCSHTLDSKIQIEG